MNIDSNWLETTLKNALAEDIGVGDHSTLATVPANFHSRGRALVKGDGVLAGVMVAEQVFRLFGPQITFEALKTDGQRVRAGDVVFFVTGSAHALLAGERVMLNFLQRLSGIATATRRLVDALAGTSCRVLDTRKTVPLLRPLDKWAVALGGGVNHRMGLYDQILIKDNHIDAAGGVAAALRSAAEYQRRNGLKLTVVVETRNLAEVEVACETGLLDRILLDNMNLQTIRQAVDIVNGRYPTEASGNIGLHNVRQIADTGVDFVSVGYLTHSVQALDISFKIS
jgi:nicotinate-nucleotide pyrophosphorylase (carboxylating)